MRTRAADLRGQAATAEWNGTRDAVLAIAERYEQIAATRTAAR